MIKFYSVTFTTKLNKEREVVVIGTEQQVNDYAIREASGYGCYYDVKYMATDNVSGFTVLNLCNT